jgi:hypothetical protein
MRWCLSWLRYLYSGRATHRRVRHLNKSSSGNFQTRRGVHIYNQHTVPEISFKIQGPCAKKFHFGDGSSDFHPIRTRRVQASRYDAARMVWWIVVSWAIRNFRYCLVIQCSFTCNCNFRLTTYSSRLRSLIHEPGQAIKWYETIVLIHKSASLRVTLSSEKT